jgi:hypothetical protein
LHPEDLSLKERLERRAREVIGVRIECELVSTGALGSDDAQKQKWLTNE